jgi:mediator of RNA polymerase II transcription subunit 12
VALHLSNLQFINNGLKTVTEILRNLSMASKKSLNDGFERAGELLRVIAYVAEPLRAAGSQLPALDPAIQDEFFEVLNDKFVKVEQALTVDDAELSLGTELTHAAISLSRLLQLHLGFPVTWTPKIKELSITLSGTIFRLVLVRRCWVTRIFADGFVSFMAVEAGLIWGRIPS